MYIETALLPSYLPFQSDFLFCHLCHAGVPKTHKKSWLFISKERNYLLMWWLLYSSSCKTLNFLILSYGSGFRLDKPDFLLLIITHWVCCSLAVDDFLLSNVMAPYVIWFFFPLIWSFVFICPWLKHSFLSFTPSPPHCVVQPRGKSSQAHPGHPESVPRHRYLSWTLETRDHDGTSVQCRVCWTDTLF